MRTTLLLPILATLTCAGSVRADGRDQDSARDTATVQPAQSFVKTFCVDCHGLDKPRGGVRLDGPLPDLSDQKSAAKWLAVKRMVSQGQMPPDGSRQPTADDAITFIAWIDEAAARAAVVTRGGLGRRALRRLTNNEYANTLQDLLGLSFPHVLFDLTHRLPSDAAPGSFSNDSNLQVMQRLQLQRRLDLAEDLLSVALPDEDDVKPLRYSADMRQFAAESLTKFNALSEAERTRQGGVAARGALPSEIAEAEPARMEIRGDRGNLNMIVRADWLDPARGLMLEPNPILAGVSRNNVAVLLPFVPDRGILRLRANVAALIDCDDSVPILRLSFGGASGPGNTAYPAAQVAVAPIANAGQAGTREMILEIPLSLAPGDWNSFRREKQLWVQIDNAAALLGPTKAPDKFDSKDRDKFLKRNRLLIESFTLEVERSPTWPPESGAVLQPSRKGDDDHARARRSLAAFLSRAFRRPASEAEVASFQQLYLNQRKAGAPFVAAYRAAVAAALISPQLQYFVETKGDKRSPLTDWELAARLSYFAWNTTPDAELLARAADGTLSSEAELRRQCSRLLSDDRSFAMARDFTRQWLGLDLLHHLEPAVSGAPRWPDSAADRQWYDKTIRFDLAAEPAHFLVELLRNDRPITELVASDHVVVNDRLARYYGISDVNGPGWQRVAAPANRRGGLLTQAGCIAAGTHGLERGEIKRGVYLARRFLGLDIPPPPGNVDIKPLDIQLKEDKSLTKLTSRLLVERHLVTTSCALCHQRTDPLGFVWSEFDRYGTLERDKLGNVVSVDTSGMLPDKTIFADFNEFRDLMTEGECESRFAVAFSRRLFSYALGRGLDPGDEVHLKAVRATAMREKGGLRALLTAMVLSEPFRNK